MTLLRSLGFDDSLSVGVDRELSRTFQLWDRGQEDEAVRALASLAVAHPKSARVHGVFGSRLYKRGNWWAAAESFARAAALSPRSELASLGLFHSRWNAGDRDAAFAEVSRFVSAGGRSAEYDRLIREWDSDADLPPAETDRDDTPSA